MATYVKVNDFVEHLAEGAHDLDTHTLQYALTNTAPASETSNPLSDGNGLIANLTQIAYTNLGSRALGAPSTSAVSSGTYTLDFADTTMSATGAVATFRYLYLYNLDTAVLADPLICHFDYGSGLTLANGESLTVQYNVSGLFTLA